MKQPRPPSDDAEAQAWVQEGLRALREQAPSEESRRAALARLGIDPQPAARGPHEETGSTGVWRWLAWGLLLGVVAVLLRRFVLL